MSDEQPQETPHWPKLITNSLKGTRSLQLKIITRLACCYHSGIRSSRKTQKHMGKKSNDGRRRANILGCYRRRYWFGLWRKTCLSVTTLLYSSTREHHRALKLGFLKLFQAEWWVPMNEASAYVEFWFTICWIKTTRNLRCALLCRDLPMQEYVQPKNRKISGMCVQRCRFEMLGELCLWQHFKAVQK